MLNTCIFSVSVIRNIVDMQLAYNYIRKRGYKRISNRVYVGYRSQAQVQSSRLYNVRTTPLSVFNNIPPYLHSLLRQCPHAAVRAAVHGPAPQHHTAHEPPLSPEHRVAQSPLVHSHAPAHPQPEDAYPDAMVGPAAPALPEVAAQRAATEREATLAVQCAMLKLRRAQRYVVLDPDSSLVPSIEY